MEQFPVERQRIISVDESINALSIQARLFPEIMDELTKLSGGSYGVLNAVLHTVADEISYTPAEKTTPSRIRAIVGAPEGDSELESWREGFWDRFKAASEN